MAKDGDIPRWAKDLAPGVWEKIEEYLDAGWKTMDIVRVLHIPPAKVRSLQEHVRKYGPRRRLIQFARFKDAVLQQIETFGEQMVLSLSAIAARAVSSETKPAVQVRALEAMTNFVNVLEKMMDKDAKEARECDLRVEVRDERETLSDKAIKQIKSIYGLDRGAGDEPGSA